MKLQGSKRAYESFYNLPYASGRRNRTIGRSSQTNQNHRTNKHNKKIAINHK